MSKTNTIINTVFDTWLVSTFMKAEMISIG